MSKAEMHRSAQAWADEVCHALGIDSSSVHRLVIDIRAGELPRIYVEGYPAEALFLEVTPPSIEWIEMMTPDE